MGSPDAHPERNILLETKFGKAKFDVLQDNIVNSSADVLVSSDDNHLQARGGVAKAIWDAAGPSMHCELEQRRAHRLRQGKIAVTGGGNLNCRAVVHPAVIDLDENGYPDETIIRSIVRLSIQCAISLGASRIAFPVIGGGTASKRLTASESARAIILEITEVLSQQAEYACNGLTYVALYVFDKSALADMDLTELVHTKPMEADDGKKAWTQGVD